MDDPILHDRLPDAPWLDPAAWRLPGVQPLDPALWLIRDEAFAAQMALRDRLIAGTEPLVHALLPAALPAAQECLEMVIEALSADEGYRFGAAEALRPDGVTVPIDRDRPLIAVGRLMQADVCLMEEGEDEHVLTGAILCFPASWTLSEKIGRPLMRIHKPVATYDAAIGMRVQRLFDAIRPGQVLWRANAIRHHDPSLFHPRREEDSLAVRRGGPSGPYIRSERQTFRRLPDSRAVAFTIHTRMIPVDRLTPGQRDALPGAGLA